MSAIKVLLIEDDHDDARLLQDLMRDAGRATFILETAFLAQDGLALLKKTRFDVILLDYRLPDMDGLSVLQEIEKLHYQIPVVIVTSHGDRNLQARAIEQGAAEFLEKGSITTDLLERTCLYAIGLNEKKTNNSGPGVGQLIEQLVGLTRESVKAQAENAQEVRELRRELAAGFEKIQEDSKAHLKYSEKRHNILEESIQDLSQLRWLLKWVAAHPKMAFVIFGCLIAFCLFLVLVFHALDIEKVGKIRDAFSSLTGVCHVG